MLGIAVFAMVSCGGTDDQPGAHVTAPGAEYFEEEALEDVSEEELEAAIGGGADLSQDDMDRIVEQAEVSGDWYALTAPLWSILGDPAVPYEEFVPLYIAAEDDLASILETLEESTNHIDNAEIAETFGALQQNMSDQLAGFGALADAVQAEDTTAVRAAENQLNSAVAEGRELQDTMLTRESELFDAAGYCRSIGEAAATQLPDLCGAAPPTTNG